jgi:hypothetical protein
MTFAGLAEQDGTNGRTRAQSFFDEARAFDANRTRFGRKAAAKSDAKFFKPAIVTAGEESRRGRSGAIGFERFARSGHSSTAG